VHRLVDLELAGRFPADADIEAVREAAIATSPSTSQRPSRSLSAHAQVRSNATMQGAPGDTHPCTHKA